jgi:hypothetical protein
MMIALVKDRHLLEKPNRVEIVQGDAFEVVATLQQRFDVILVDLFNARDPEPRLSSPKMIADLSTVLAYDGFLFLNVFEKKELFSDFSKIFTTYNQWRYEFNALAEFRHQGLGHMNDPLPVGFIHPLQSPDYLKGTVYVNDSHSKIITSNGMRRFMGPMAMDLFGGQEEPVIEPFHGWRMLVWQPVAKRSCPTGWLPWPIPSQPKHHAVAEVLPGDYWTPWSDHAKRHRKKWLAQTHLSIEEISFEAFTEAFNASGKLPKARAGSIEALRRRVGHENHHVRFFGAYYNKRIVAALAVCDLRDISLSVHCAAFNHPDFEKTSVGTGLIDHWYKHCQKENIRFAYFDIVWSPGDPKGWIGYSNFKKQFRPYLLTSPLPFVKFTLS